MSSEPQLPVPATTTAVEEYAGSESHWAQRPRQRQDLTVALLPLALVVVMVLVFAVALWTLAATAPGL